MLKNAFSRVLVSLFVVLSIVSQGTLVLAGTTGTLSGTVIDSSTKQPLVGAKLTATSPSQIATATTDSKGHFELLSLAPDTYTLTVSFNGYDASSLPGVSIFADNTRDLVIPAQKTQKTIAIVKSKPASSLVKAGTTADVYSVDSAAQAKVAVAGGGTNLDSAFSALATVPGVEVAPGQSGYIGAGPAISIRGGDYNQIGYEIDGVPVNRSFDNYPSGPTSSLGQQELQVYTGAPPADSQSAGISGYINQVIKTGTSPGFESVTAALGGPAYYHKLNAEIGGASADHRFSYYVGIGGYNQQIRPYDQYSGASLDNTYGYPVSLCAFGYSQSVAPSCYTPGGTPYSPYSSPLALGPYNLFATSFLSDRDNVVNLHYYFPHKDGSRDDLQALYQVNQIDTYVYSSTNDQGGAAQVAAIDGGFGGAANYDDGLQLKLPTGGFLPSNYQNYVSPYYFPNTPTHPVDGVIDPNLQDLLGNAQAITKVQFTKSLGANAFARIYGYTYYSNFEYSGPNSADAFFGAFPGDYELSAHTRGLSGAITDQINSQNLINISGSFTTATALRDYNSEYADTGSTLSSGTVLGVLVDSSNPTNGVCYTAAAVATNCFSNTPQNGTALNSSAGYATIAQAAAGSITPAPATNCGGGPCKYLILGNGADAVYNQVKPKFYGASISDEFRPNSKLTINAGIRLDDYQYEDGNTSGGNARTFIYNAYNAEECENTTSHLLTDKAELNLATNATCPQGYMAVNFTNPSSASATFPVFQPRLGATYSIDPNTVIRASYGRYAQPATTAIEQYDYLQSEAPLTLYGSAGFQQFGYTTPDHNVPPATSNNYDFSVEHQFPGQVSIKVTPFYRETANQQESIVLNRVTNFVSGLNVGNQTSKGFEFELDKGNFAQNGLSAKLSFAYTNNSIKYYTLANGSTVLQPVIDAITAYNALTKAGHGSPCYGLAVNGNPGAAESCSTPGAVANPYYNAPEQSTAAYSSGASTVPFDVPPSGLGDGVVAIGVPYVTSLILNEKINKFAIAPVLQYFAGQRYGAPITTNGVDPTSCSATLAGSPSSDPRYQYGAAGGSPYDVSSCTGTLSIPNVSTGSFDGIGAFVEPSQVVLGLQMSYEATKNFTLTANLANVANTCFGGTKNIPWAVKGACQYSATAFGAEGAAGNVYNPGDVIQPAVKNAYGPVFNQQPFNLFVSGNFKI